MDEKRVVAVGAGVVGLHLVHIYAAGLYLAFLHNLLVANALAAGVEDHILAAAVHTRQVGVGQLLVGVEVDLLGEALIADNAVVGLLATVDQPVPIQLGRGREALVAKFAGILFGDFLLQHHNLDKRKIFLNKSHTRLTGRCFESDTQTNLLGPYAMVRNRLLINTQCLKMITNYKN